MHEHAVYAGLLKTLRHVQSSGLKESVTGSVTASVTWRRREELVVEASLVSSRDVKRYRLYCVITQLQQSRHLARHHITAATCTSAALIKRLMQSVRNQHPAYVVSYAGLDDRHHVIDSVVIAAQQVD